VHDQANPYRYIQVRGLVESKTTDGADAHIDKMSLKYTANATYAGRAANPSERRVICRIRPEHLQTMG
jgi:hypothetical protein